MDRDQLGLKQGVDLAAVATRVKVWCATAGRQAGTAALLQHTVGRGKAGAARHDFGSSSAVVHESESATVDRQAGSGRSLEAQSAGFNLPH